MAALTDTLLAHEIRGPKSCVSWGLELVAKLHDELPLAEYPIQARYPSGVGFGEDGRALLADYRVKAEEAFLSYEEFKAVCTSEVQAGFPPLVSLITIAEVVFHPFGFSKSKHVFCATLHEGRLYFLTRAHGHDDVFNFALPEVKVLYELARVVEPDYRFHVLKHRHL